MGWSKWSDLGFSNWSDYGWNSYLNPAGTSKSLADWAAFSMDWTDKKWANLPSSEDWSSTQEWVTFALKGFEQMDFKKFAYSIGLSPKEVYPRYQDGDDFKAVIQRKWPNSSNGLEKYNPAFPVTKMVEYNKSKNPLISFLKDLGASEESLKKAKKELSRKTSLMTPLERMVRFGLILKQNSMVKALNKALIKSGKGSGPIKKYALAGTLKRPCRSDETESAHDCSNDPSKQIGPKTVILNGWDGMYGPRNQDGSPKSKVIPVEASFLVPSDCSARYGDEKGSFKKGDRNIKKIELFKFKHPYYNNDHNSSFFYSGYAIKGTKLYSYNWLDKKFEQLHLIKTGNIVDFDAFPMGEVLFLSLPMGPWSYAGVTSFNDFTGRYTRERLPQNKFNSLALAQGGAAYAVGGNCIAERQKYHYYPYSRWENGNILSLRSFLGRRPSILHYTKNKYFFNLNSRYCRSYGIYFQDVAAGKNGYAVAIGNMGRIFERIPGYIHTSYSSYHNSEVFNFNRNYPDINFKGQNRRDEKYFSKQYYWKEVGFKNQIYRQRNSLIKVAIGKNNSVVAIGFGNIVEKDSMGNWKKITTPHNNRYFTDLVINDDGSAIVSEMGNIHERDSRGNWKFNKFKTNVYMDLKLKNNPKTAEAIAFGKTRFVLWERSKKGVWKKKKIRSQFKTLNNSIIDISTFSLLNINGLSFFVGATNKGNIIQKDFRSQMQGDWILKGKPETSTAFESFATNDKRMIIAIKKDGFVYERSKNGKWKEVVFFKEKETFVYSINLDLKNSGEAYLLLNDELFLRNKHGHWKKSKDNKAYIFKNVSKSLRNKEDIIKRKDGSAIKLSQKESGVFGIRYSPRQKYTFKKQKYLFEKTANGNWHEVNVNLGPTLQPTYPIIEEKISYKLKSKKGMRVLDPFVKKKIRGALCDFYQKNHLGLEGKGELEAKNPKKVEWLKNKVLAQIDTANKSFAGSGIQFKLVDLKFIEQNKQLLGMNAKPSSSFEKVINQLGGNDADNFWKINLSYHHILPYGALGMSQFAGNPDFASNYGIHRP